MTQDDRSIQRALAHFSGYRRRLVVLAGISVVGAFLEAFSYAVVVPIAAAAVGGREGFSFGFGGVEREVGIGVLFGTAVAAVLLRAGVALWGEYLSAEVIGRYAANQQRRALRAVLAARWAVQAEEQEGKLQDVVTTYLARAQMGLRNLAMGLHALVSFLIFAIGALAVGGAAALVILAVVGLLFLLLRPISKRAHANSLALTQETPRFAHALSQSLRMAREIRLFRAGRAVFDRAAEVIERLRSGILQQRMLAAVTPTAYQAVGLLVVLGGLGVILAADVGPVETLAATAILTLKALQYGRNVQSEYHACHDLLPFVEMLEQRLVDLESAGDRDAGDRLDGVETLELRDVSFGYASDLPVVAGVSFKLAAGDCLGIIGPSGGGKSTLLQLLLRLRDPDAGQILANGRPAEAFAKSSWYERIAFVPQDAQLFSDTILENIRVFRADVSRDGAVEAARLAGVHAEIEALERGFDTEAGDRGNRLSGGQRQRLTIARALAGKPDVVLFDEPTSALDMHSEAAVQEALRRMSGKTTLVVVAHRLSTLSICDSILVLRDGKVEAYGPREELMRQEGYFQEVSRLAGLK